MSFRGAKSGTKSGGRPSQSQEQDKVAAQVSARDFKSDPEFLDSPQRTDSKFSKSSSNKTPSGFKKDINKKNSKPTPTSTTESNHSSTTSKPSTPFVPRKTQHVFSDDSIQELSQPKSADNTTKKKSFDFAHLKPFIPQNECMICSSPILLYAGSTCDHMNELCGECLLKLKLFAKQNTTNTTINPQTGEEEQHRATVVIKPEYTLQCDAESTNPTLSSPTQAPSATAAASSTTSFSSLNIISDPTLDVDFVSQARTRDPVCLFCHTQISPLLLSRTPVKPATYQLLRLLIDLKAFPTESSKYKSLQKDIEDLMAIAINSKGGTPLPFSKYIETTFIYNAHLDIYTLSQDGTEFAENIENACAITCKKCTQFHDNQKDYVCDRELKVDFNGYPVTYQSTPLIIPPTNNMKFSYITTLSTLSSTEDPETIDPETAVSRIFLAAISTLTYKHASFSSLRQLQHHVQKSHHLDLCTACSSISHEFISSHPLYTHKDLLHHGRQHKHSFCTLCRHQAYDNDELYVHLIDAGNHHYMCRLCTTTSTPHPSDLAPDQPAIKKETFKFFRNKAAYVLHLHQQHYVCTHDKCKQWQNNTNPSSVRNPSRIISFASPLELQQHIQNVHQEKKQNASKKIDISAMFLASNTATNTSTTPLPGHARVNKSLTAGTATEYTLSADDILVYTRVVQLAGHHGDTHRSQVAPNNANNNIPNSSGASVDIVADGSAFQPIVEGRYNELFPSLGNTTSSHAAGQNYALKKTTSQELFPTFGKTAPIAASAKKTSDSNKAAAFPALGATKSSQSVSKTSTSSSNKPITSTSLATAPSSAPANVVAKSTAPVTAKKNNLNAFINWDRVQTSSHQFRLDYQRTVTQDYFDYALDQTTHDTNVPSYAQTYYTPVAASTQSSFAEAMGAASNRKGIEQKDTKKLTGDHSVDFPSFLGTSSAALPQPQPTKQQQKGNKKGQQAKSGSKQAANVWGVTQAPQIQPQTQQPKPKTKIVNSVNNNANNTGLASTATAPPPTSKAAKSAANAEIKAYHEELQHLLDKTLPEIDTNIRQIFSNSASRGKKNELIQKYLFGTLYDCSGVVKDDESISIMPFQNVLVTLSKHSPNRFLSGFQTLELFQHIFQTTLKNVLDDSHRKAICFTLQQIAILAQSLCSDTDDEPSIFTFHTFPQIVALVPNTTQLQAMAKSFQDYFDRVNKKGPTQLPGLQFYPDLGSHPITDNNKKTQELVAILAQQDATTAIMNKRFLSFITHNMDLPKRVYLYVYLHQYMTKFLFSPTILQRFLFDNLRGIDAKEETK